MREDSRQSRRDSGTRDFTQTRDGSRGSDRPPFRSGGSGRPPFRSGGSGRPPFRSGGDRFSRGPQEMHKATCAECGTECEVPFKPAEGRPVYCRDCFAKHKPQRF